MSRKFILSIQQTVVFIEGHSWTVTSVWWLDELVTLQGAKHICLLSSWTRTSNSTSIKKKEWCITVCIAKVTKINQHEATQEVRVLYCETVTQWWCLTEFKGISKTNFFCEEIITYLTCSMKHFLKIVGKWRISIWERLHWERFWKERPLKNTWKVIE